MTLQCVPGIIRGSLQTIIGERNFSSEAVVSVTREANTKISSSCNVAVCEDGRRLVLFIKYLSDVHEGFGREVVSYFRNEVVFYTDILQEFEKVMTEATVTNARLTFAPSCLAAESRSTDQPFLVMEDLLAGGHEPLDIRRPLTLEQARLTLDQLGRFHAFSFAARDKRPLSFASATSKLCETVFREETRGTLGKLLIHSIHDVFKLVKQSFSPGSQYVDKFANFTLNIFDKMIAWIECDEEDATYKVLTHGDLWPNNILCKFSTFPIKPLESVTFIDYQACRMSSPVHDLQLFMLTALDKTTRDEHRLDLIRHYHTSLCRTLLNLGCDPLMLFPYSALQNQLFKQSQFALAVALAGLPLFLHEGAIPVPNLEHNGEKSIDTLLNFVRNVQMSKSMRCKNKMLEIIMDVVDQGYL